jgi:hypothetical protein
MTMSAVFALHRIESSVTLLKRPILHFENDMANLFGFSNFLISPIFLFRVLDFVAMLFSAIKKFF